MRIPSILGAIAAIVLAAALGCGPKAPVTNPSGSFDRECSLLWPHSEPAETVTVALFDDVNPTHAPVWQNEAERLVFRHLYDPCESEFFPCTPFTWLLEEDSGAYGNGVLCTLRKRNFWDGSPVTANDVVASLRRGLTSNSGIDSVIAIDDLRFAVFFRGRGTTNEWTKLSAFAVTKSSISNWPVGSGMYRIIDGYSIDDITIEPWRASRPVIRFIDAQGVDARDLLDPSIRPRIDFAILHDRDVVEYARTLDRFEVLDLPPTRAYVLLAPSRSAAIHNDRVPDEVCLALARDAVRRSYAVPLANGPWTKWLHKACTLQLDSPPASTTVPRILFDAADETARDLAERLVSMISSPEYAAALGAAIPGFAGSKSVSAVGLAYDELAARMARGEDLAYVIGLPYEPLNGLEATCALLRSAPWLSGNGGIRAMVLPLVATHPCAIVAKNGSGFGFDVRLDENDSIVILGLPDPLPQ
jgi:hypothetical protein